MALHTIRIDQASGGTFMLTSAHIRSGGVFKDAWKTRKAALQNAYQWVRAHEGDSFVMLVDGVVEEPVVTAVSYSPKMGLTVYAYNGHAHYPAIMVAQWIQEGLIGRNDVSDLIGESMYTLQRHAESVVKGTAGAPLETAIHVRQQWAAHTSAKAREYRESCAAEYVSMWPALVKDYTKQAELWYKQARMARKWLSSRHNPCPAFRPAQTF